MALVQPFEKSSNVWRRRLFFSRMIDMRRAMIFFDPADGEAITANSHPAPGPSGMARFSVFCLSDSPTATRVIDWRRFPSVTTRRRFVSARVVLNPGVEMARASAMAERS